MSPWSLSPPPHLLAQLSPEERARVEAYLEHTRIPAGGTAVREGDPGPSMFFVLEGKGHLARGGLRLQSIGAGESFGELGPRDVLLIEGIHGLNPALLGEILPREQLFKVFIHPVIGLPFDRLSSVSPADIRLLRRIVRDRHGRGYKAADNILRWPSVRDGERRHIFPFLPEADAIFDTSLVYEPSVLKVYAERYLLEIPREHPGYTTAFRLRRLLDRFVTIYPDHVPPTSLLREFIGGSGFEY
jgi:hypothetical protein